MKSLKSLFATLTLLAVSFACAPVADQAAVTEAPTAEPTVTVEEAAFPWTDDAANCCGHKPILNKPKI